MIDQKSVAAVDSSRWLGRFVKPLYDSYCFSRIPSTVESLFGAGVAREPRLLGGADRYETVILLLIDGFGWRFFERYGDNYPFLKRFVTDGRVAKLTSQFPSTTAAHITTIHTGLDVGQSGVYEWFMYEPSLDTVISPLRFNRVTDKEAGTLEREGVRPESIFPGDTIHQRLDAAGVKSYVYQSAAFTPSPYTNVVSGGAVLHPFASFEDGLRDLVETATSHHGPAYHYLYLGDIDEMGHQQGPDSPQFAAITDVSFRALESALMDGLRGKLRDGLLLMTADHGQVEIDPARAVYVDEIVPETADWLQRSPGGHTITPSGIWRDMYLHIAEEHLEEAEARLQTALDGVEVHRVTDLVTDGFFGCGAPSEIFNRRIGNLCLLPEEDRLVWWAGNGYPRPRFRGNHGGLSPQEMETELLSYEL